MAMSAVMLGLSPHARKQMAVRDISEAEIEDALKNETERYPSADLPDERLVILGTTGNNRRLRVVVETEDTGYIVTVADRNDER